MAHLILYHRWYVSFWFVGLVVYGPLALVHCPHRLAGKVRSGFVAVQWVEGGCFIRSRPNLGGCIARLQLARLGLRPGKSPLLYLVVGWVVVPRPHRVALLPLVVLGWWLI